ALLPPWSTCCEICLVTLVVGLEPSVRSPSATASTPAAALYSRCSPSRDLARSSKARISSASSASLDLRSACASSSKPLVDVAAAPRATHDSVKHLNRGRMRNSNRVSARLFALSDSRFVLFTYLVDDVHV
ncbi:hypothetical protein ACJX0J_041944, partial [Zea mays]